VTHGAAIWREGHQTEGGGGGGGGGGGDDEGCKHVSASHAAGTVRLSLLLCCLSRALEKKKTFSSLDICSLDPLMHAEILCARVWPPGSDRTFLEYLICQVLKRTVITPMFGIGVTFSNTILSLSLSRACSVARSLSVFL